MDWVKQDVYVELGRDVQQFAWSTDGTSLFYLERKGDLHQYHLRRGESEHIISDVSGFSVAPNGKWLGLSIRDPNRSRAFTFRVLDLSDGHLLTIADQRDISLGINESFWSPTADEVVVLSGPDVEMYEVRENHLQVKAAVDARDTYQRDFGRDLISVALGCPVWSPDGQKLLLIRSSTDAKLGGEALLFDAALSDYQRLPFGDNVTYASWTKDSKWLTYVTSNGGRNTSSSCADFFRGKIWLADIETLKTQVVVTDAFSIYPPAWRP
jgi:Tol biopolymer transport system component